MRTYAARALQATRKLRITARMAKQLDYHTIREIFTRFEDSEPEPKGELDHVNVYTLVVAVALSAQATDAGVNKATKELFKICLLYTSPSPRDRG